MPAAKAFGELFKKRRIALGITLREFCRRHGLDSGNMSRLERGVQPPPTSRDKLRLYAQLLKIEEGTDDWYEFFDLAAACAGRIPEEIRSDEELVKKLPVIFRTLRGRKLTDEQLDELVNATRNA
jgi:transcriptional regulator with XRE-family HTH domain